MELKHFSAPIEFKADDEGTFEGHASIFDKEDSYGDVVKSGAFLESLKTIPQNRVKMLRGHDPNAIIGVWESIKEDAKGLAVKGKLLLDIDAAKETFSLMKVGVLDSMSIGFRTVVDQFDSDTNIRSLVEVKLYEVSLVTFPAQPDALVSSVKDISKSELTTKRELECALRDAGFSISTSKYISAGWTSPALRDAEGKNETVTAIEALVTKFQQASGV